MRMDKYLKVSRLIKRRTVAKRACNDGNVFINGKEAKPSSEVNIGDHIRIEFGQTTVKVEVLDTKKHVRKGKADTMYTYL